MSDATGAVIILNRALDQLGDVLTAVHEDHFGRPTPCSGWSVGDLVGHVLAAPGRFLEMGQGGHPDWSTDPAPPAEGWAAQFRASADDLIHFWHQQGDDAPAGSVDWQTAEFAVHTWDLARAIGRRTDRLDPEIAERGLAFMAGALTPGNRGGAFGPEVPVPEDAPVYDRLAGFAGRDPA